MPDVHLLFGPMLIGVFVNMILYGILIMQTYHYYQMYKKDTPWIRTLVLYLFIVETLNTGADMSMMYEPLIGKFGLPDAAKNFPIMFAAEPVAIVAVSTPIQLFFSWRVWLLTKSKILATFIVALSLLSLAGGIWTTVLIVSIKVFARKPELHTPALVWFLSASVADVLITAVLVFTLSRKKTGFIATDDAISKIIRLTVQTGMLTAFFAVGDVVFFMALPHTALNFVWDLALSKLYTNCLLSTLNARSPRQDSGFHSEQRGTNGNRARNPESMIPQFLSSSMYELETTQKSFGQRSSDLEYGISVTKVIETKEDPAPRVYSI